MGLLPEDIGKALSEMLSDDDEIVVMQGGIWSFAHQLRIHPAELTTVLLDLFVGAIGPDRTMLMPTFTNGTFSKTKTYDLILTAPETGALPTAALRYPGAIRTPHPMNNYVAIGPRAEEAAARIQTTCWGNDSVLGWFDETNALLIMYGLTWEAATPYIHRAEEKQRVPYRYFKRFTGRRTIDGVDDGACSDVLFVRPWDAPLTDSKEWIREDLASAGKVRICAQPNLMLEGIKALDFLAACETRLTEDPYAMVRNREEIIAWVETGKDPEIARLSPGETYREPTA